MEIPVANAKAGRRGAYGWLGAVLSVYLAVFLTYSQTWAFTYDESYHLLAAQLINSGKRPYLDFCFPQTPLNALWNAGWMRILGQSWRVAHFFAALFTIGAVILTAEFAFRRFPVPAWRPAAALIAGLGAGLNVLVFDYGPLAPYGICLFMLVAAFRICIRAVDRSGPLLPAGAGLCAGIAAGSSLLSAAGVPVLLLWMLVYNRAGRRWTKLSSFACGAVVPFAPVFWLFWLGPQQTWFNLARYHSVFRQLYWPNPLRHDLEILASWIDSGQGLVLGLLALFGVIFIARRSDWPACLKAEFYLCALLAATLAFEVSLAHPTFAQYFVLTVPFLAVLAVPGLYAIASRVLDPDLHHWPVLLVVALFVLGLGKTLNDDSEDNTWSTFQRVANKVEQVTAPNALLLAEEPIYFLTKRTPPSGFELSYTHRVHLPHAQAALFHILTGAEVKGLVQSGMFPTAASCDSEDTEEFSLKERYAQQATVEHCTVFWNPKKNP